MRLRTVYAEIEYNRFGIAFGEFMDRIVHKVVYGALFGGAIATIPAILMGAMIILGDSHPEDREEDLVQLPVVFMFCSVPGIIVGGLAGVASSVSETAIPFLRCCGIIGSVALIVRLVTNPYKFQSPTLSFIFTLTAVMMTTAVLVWVGRHKKAPS